MGSLVLIFKQVTGVIKVANKRSTDSRWLSLFCKMVLVSGIFLRTVCKRTNCTAEGGGWGTSCVAAWQLPPCRMALPLYSGGCVPLPSSHGVCPRLMGHSVCGEAP